MHDGANTASLKILSRRYKAHSVGSSGKNSEKAKAKNGND